MIIIGSGPAGLAAALYAARANLQPVVFTGMLLGGQVANTYIVENYPGFPEGIGGPELIEAFQKQAERFGARIEYDSVTALDLSERPFKITTYGGEHYAKTLILTTGANPRKLEAPGEEEFNGRGVSYCATCDGHFFTGKDVVVIGGGDSAMEEGLFLTRFANSVTVIHRRDQLRAGKLMQERVFDHPKVNFIWDTVITEIIGEGVVRKVKLHNLKTGQHSELATDGVFIFIGHIPNTELYKGQLEMDELGYLVVDKYMQTNIPGVFAAGEVADSHFRQVITSAGMGAAAAMQAIRFLEKQTG
ncbi:MAG: thioredoxin-disulfide reductase [Chloroflexi bacterium]|nr:thioredoxin-disulfide reductase [Chloroflexota bacterium]